MSDRRRPRPQPADPYSWLLCPDCASVVRTVHPEQGVMDVIVEHSSSCPAWRSPRSEVALRLLPKGMPAAEVERHGTVLGDQEQQQ